MRWEWEREDEGDGLGDGWVGVEWEKSGSGGKVGT